MSIQSPYADGIDAGYRTGKYKDATDTPPCPFPDGAKEYADWWDGFGDATEDLIAYQRSA